MTDKRDNAKLERLAREAAEVENRKRIRRANAAKLPAERDRASAALSDAKKASAASRKKHRAAVAAARRNYDNVLRRIETAVRNGDLPADETDPPADPQDSRPAAEIWEEDGRLLVRTIVPVPGFPKAARAIGGGWNGRRWSFPAERADEARGLARRHYAAEER